MAKQTVIRPSGIVTQPNEYGDLPPGTLKTGDGIQLRRSGVIEPRNAFRTWSAAGGGDQRKIWPLPDGRVICIAPSGLSYQTYGINPGGGTFSVDLAGSDTLTEYTPGKTHITHTRDRAIFTYQKYPVVCDVPDSTLSTMPARQAGLPPPVWLDIDISTTAGDGLWLLADNCTAYRALYKRKFSDGYIVVGAASIAIASNITPADCRPIVTVYALGNFPLQAGDLVELYRVPQQTEVDLLGADYRLATVHELTNTEVAFGFATISDNVYDEQLSDYLYVNGEQDGPSKQNYMPPPSYDVFTHKNATFYATSEAWHAVKVKLPPMVATAGEERGFGGPRGSKTGAIATSGSANITNVANVTGIAVGQVLDTGSATFPAGAYVTAISGAGPYTVTMSANALATVNPYTFSVLDTIEIDGVKYEYVSFFLFMEDFSLAVANGDTDVIVLPEETVVSTTGDLGVTLTFFMPVPSTGPFTIRASHGENFSPPLPDGADTPQTSLAEARTDRLHFSKISQPEAVPPDNTLLVGSGTILKMWGTQDSLFVCCTDGIFRVDGDGDDWSVKPVDPDTILLAPDAVDSMDNQIYAWTTAGFISLTDSRGMQKISATLIDDELRDLWTQFSAAPSPIPYTWDVQLICDKYRREVWLNFNDLDDDSHEKTWIWNVNTGTFVTQSAEEPSAIAYDAITRSILLGVSSGGEAGEIRQYDDDTWMDTNVEFNSVFADDLGILKQWIDVTLFLEDWSGGDFLPRFDDIQYVADYAIIATAGPLDHVVAPLLTAAMSKHCRFGFETTETPYYQLKGLSYRYRLSSEQLRQ